MLYITPEFVSEPVIGSLIGAFKINWVSIIAVILVTAGQTASQPNG